MNTSFSCLPLKPSIWKNSSSLVLASGSSIRAEMLRNASIPIEIIPADIDERKIENNILNQCVNLESVALGLALEKAKAVSNVYQDRYVLGCDQILVFDNKILTKSVSRETGLNKLKELAGKSHKLVSSAVLIKNGKILASVTDSVRLRMRILSDDFYSWYSENAHDALISSVGGYHFEKSGCHLFEEVQGDFFTILGLPLIPLIAEFRRLELVIP